MRVLVMVVSVVSVVLKPLLAQAPLTPTDTALIGRIILAEDRRDSMDAALARGAAHGDPRVRFLARRAMGRIRDPIFAARDSLGVTLPAPTAWPEPAWRLRFRELTAKRDDCAALRAAVTDSAWPVRMRAAAVARASCARDETLVAAFRSWVDALPADASHRKPHQVSWQLAAYGMGGLARLRPADAKARMPRVATHRQWQVRMYAARAATIMSDTGVLRVLAVDRDPNVKEVAIEGLSKLTGHDDDELYVQALEGDDAQAVRAAAIALKGSPLASVKGAAMAAFDRFARNQNASERDARVALLEALGKAAADDIVIPPKVVLPPRAVALALGADIRLRITMAQPDGGASFVVKLRGDAAPMMAARVLALASEGYYDNTTWHRVEHDFVVQGAGHGANEYVGYPVFFRDELGGVPHARGTVGMSTRGHDTGDSQWFFNLKDNLRLNKDYSVFAEVVEGIEVLDQILEGDVIASIREYGIAKIAVPTGGFSGTWNRVDPGEQRNVAAVGDAAFRVGDMGSGWGTPLTIAQRADSLIVEHVFFGAYDLQPPVRMAYAPNGAESVNDVILSHSTTRVKGRATQSSDALVITDLYPSPTGQATEVRHTLTLESPNTLMVEVARGSNRTRTTYTRR
jgi:cyclophilin family peptidyl-prolyl cis-trans isomerase